MTVATADEVDQPRALIYLRVSTKEQAERDGDPEGYSIPAQREANVRKAESLGARVVAEYVDRGESARSADRPELQRMLQQLSSTKPNYVIVHKVDRLARSRADDVAINLAIQKVGATLVSATENIDETPSGMLVHGIMSSIAEFYSQNLANEVIKGLAQKARSGGTNHRAPVGYLNVRATNNDDREVRTVQLDPSRAPLVRLAFELYATGEYSIERLQDRLSDQGLTTKSTRRWAAQPLSVSRLHGMLRDPYYTGIITYKGAVFPGRHEAIVDQHLFDQVQEVLDARSRTGQRDRVHFHYLKGMLFCNRCDQAGRTSRMIYTENPGSNGTAYRYFKCRGRQEGLCDLPYLPVALVEEAVVDHYATLDLPKELLDSFRTQLRVTLSDEQSATKKLHATLNRQITELDNQEERLLDLLMDGRLPQARVRTRLDKIEIDRVRLRHGLGQSSQQLALGAQILESCIELLHQPQGLYRHAPDDARRTLDQTFYTAFFVDDYGVAHSTLKAPFAQLHAAAHDRMKIVATLSEHRVETQKASSPQTRGLPSARTAIDLLRDPWVAIWSKTILVAGAGFEPATSGL